MVSYKALNTAIESIIANTCYWIRDYDWCQAAATIVSIISWLSILYALNGRKVAMWILCRYEKREI